MNYMTFFDKLFPQILTGWKTYIGFAVYMAWVMFLVPALESAGAGAFVGVGADLIEYLLMLFIGASGVSKLKRIEENLKKPEELPEEPQVLNG